MRSSKMPYGQTGETMEFIIDGQEGLDLVQPSNSGGLGVMNFEDGADDIEAKLRVEAI